MNSAEAKCTIRQIDDFVEPEKPKEEKTKEEIQQETKKFWSNVDKYSELFIIGAFSLLAALAVNAFIQSLVNLMVPPPTQGVSNWQIVVTNFFYAAIIFLIFLGIAVAYTSRKKTTRVQALLLCPNVA